MQGRFDVFQKFSVPHERLVIVEAKTSSCVFYSFTPWQSRFAENSFGRFFVWSLRNQILRPTPVISQIASGVVALNAPSTILRSISCGIFAGSMTRAVHLQQSAYLQRGDVRSLSSTLVSYRLPIDCGDSAFYFRVVQHHLVRSLWIGGDPIPRPLISHSAHCCNRVPLALRSPPGILDRHPQTTLLD